MTSVSARQTHVVYFWHPDHAEITSCFSFCTCTELVWTTSQYERSRGIKQTKNWAQAGLAFVPLNGDWTFRSQDVSFLDVSFPGTKHKFWTIRSLVVSFLGCSFPYSSQVPVCKRRPGRLT